MPKLGQQPGSAPQSPMGARPPAVTPASRPAQKQTRTGSLAPQVPRSRTTGPRVLTRPPPSLIACLAALPPLSSGCVYVSHPRHGRPGCVEEGTEHRKEVRAEVFASGARHDPKRGVPTPRSLVSCGPSQPGGPQVGPHPPREESGTDGQSPRRVST